MGAGSDFCRFEEDINSAVADDETLDAARRAIAAGDPTCSSRTRVGQAAIVEVDSYRGLD